MLGALVKCGFCLRLIAKWCAWSLFLSINDEFFIRRLCYIQEGHQIMVIIQFYMRASQNRSLGKGKGRPPSRQFATTFLDKINEKLRPRPLSQFQWWKKMARSVAARVRYRFEGRDGFISYLFCPRLTILDKINGKWRQLSAISMMEKIARFGCRASSLIWGRGEGGGGDMISYLFYPRL